MANRVQIEDGTMARLDHALASRPEGETHSGIIDQALDALEGQTPFGPEREPLFNPIGPRGSKVGDTFPDKTWKHSVFCQASDDLAAPCTCREGSGDPESDDLHTELGAVMVTARAFAVATLILREHPEGWPNHPVRLIGLGYLRGQSDASHEIIGVLSREKKGGGE